MSSLGVIEKKKKKNPGSYEKNDQPYREGKIFWNLPWVKYADFQEGELLIFSSQSDYLSRTSTILERRWVLEKK